MIETLSLQTFAIEMIYLIFLYGEAGILTFLLFEKNHELRLRVTPICTCGIFEYELHLASNPVIGPK